MDGHRYVNMQSDPPISRSHSFRQDNEWVFDELPNATIVSVSRPDASDISPVLLTYTIQFQYKQFKWNLSKKPSQVFFLHFALKKRAFLEEIYEKQEQVKEWLQNLGIGEHTAVVQDEDEADDDVGPLSTEDHHSVKKRDIPSSAALPVIRPALSRQYSVSDRAKVAMQGYLNHFLGNLDIANSREVCKFLEVSKISFLPEYGPKLKEAYVLVRHLPKVQNDDGCISCCTGSWFSCCDGNWQKVWAVLKPGFLALLEDPLDNKLLDIIVFDAIPTSDGSDEVRPSLAREAKEDNPLHNGLVVSCGSRTIKLRLRNSAKVKDWVAAINDADLRTPEGWCHPHRFGSFAPPRGLTDDGSLVQWFIDGQAAFEAIATSIEQAKSEIFITDWWLCPELYLRRPYGIHPTSRLDVLLEETAKKGVQIYILLYKEVALALKINSVYSKRKLLDIHKNIKVLRYPDHFSAGVYLWSHHEKIVIIDNQVCYLGGLDLCFGRYDTPEHKVNDCPSLTWPGKDYYNPRESEPNSWEDVMNDELDREKYPRMPWHDVQCALWGPPCRDVARHFVQRWNYAKRNKAAYEQAIPLLMPQHHMVIPHYMGEKKEIIEDDDHDENKNNLSEKDSFSTYSSLQEIPLLLSEEACGEDIPTRNRIGNGMHITPDVPFRKNKTCINSETQMKDFVEDVDGTCSQNETCSGILAKPTNEDLEEWWETQERGGQVISADEAGQAGPLTPCRCQVIRSIGQWSAGTSKKEESIHNAYFSVIENAEHFIYIENQFFISGLAGDSIIKNRVLEALYRRIMRANREGKCFRVIIVIPLLPGFQGGLDDGGAASVRAIVHWQYRTISRGSNSILQKLYDTMGPNIHDYISFYGLRSHGKLCEGGPIATNQVYVHSKVMIVDDQVILVGSANINDRSLLGSRDSEIGVLIEDKKFVGSLMDGKPWKAGKCALSLRLSLWAEHLGLRVGEVERIKDPVVDASYKDIWAATAKENTKIYQEVFACIPNDSVPSRIIIRQNAALRKEKIGHTTMDLGIIPDKLELSENGDAHDIKDPLERLQAVRGHLVCFPLEFMCQEDLRPVFNESEFYTSAQVFH
ncbi:Phospholipase D zeta [Zostera marina]|uniref:Phospholipase n=1 Tax=Zostera marina TaxID=29655 RepID=A0A0K9P137_ZOSMR|nr:Phospholipase D zeta [Zostera marina]